MRRPRSAVLAGASVIAAATGCVADAVPSLDRVGVTRTGGDRPSVLFVGCEGDRVERVALYRGTDAREGGGSVLWQIDSTASSGEQPGSFVLGATPPGFRELVPYEEPLARDDDAFAVVTSRDHGTLGVSFSVDELRRGEVVVPGAAPREPNEFVEKAGQGCPDG